MITNGDRSTDGVCCDWDKIKDDFLEVIWKGSRQVKSSEEGFPGEWTVLYYFSTG